MRNILLAAGLLAAASATPALAQAAAPGAQKPPMTRAQAVEKAQRHFARADADRDGFISQAEHQAMAARRGERQAKHAMHRAPGAMFDRLDANRDGSISRAEFDAGHAQRMQRRAAGAGAHRGHGMGGRMFAMADADKDGRVSLAEATAMSLRRFERLDTNRDGAVTREERQQRRMQRRTAG